MRLDSVARESIPQASAGDETSTTQDKAGEISEAVEGEEGGIES